MPFSKGYSGNIKGRPKGASNLKSRELQDVILAVLESTFRKTNIIKDLKELSPKQRLDFTLRLVEFMVPKPKAQDDILPRQETMSEIHRRVTALLIKGLEEKDKNPSE